MTLTRRALSAMLPAAFGAALLRPERTLRPITIRFVAPEVLVTKGITQQVIDARMPTYISREYMDERQAELSALLAAAPQPLRPPSPESRRENDA